MVVLMFDCLDGETCSTGLCDITLWVSGVTKVAFVLLGTASRLTGGGGGMFPSAFNGDDIKPTADGVGVMGGTAFAARFLLGVDGPALLPFISGSVVVSEVFFLFLLILAAVTAGELAIASGSSLVTFEAALKRAERLEDMV